MTVIKICGIRRLEDAVAAAEAGAGLLGFVFAGSRRQVTPADARAIVQEVRLHAPVQFVGVFVNESADGMKRVADQVGLDYVQLSGDEGDEIITRLDVPVIRTLHVGAATSTTQLAACMAASPAALLLLDTAGSGQYGGTGRAFDWTVLPPLERPTLLAGGLHAGNAVEAVRQVRPWGLDVSSGVETDGGKDPEKIREFIGMVRGTI